MPEVINWRIALHPMNWVVLFLMVFIAALALHFIMVWESGNVVNQTA